MQPCFTPRLTLIVSVILSPYLMQILSLVYIFFMTLKNFPSIPKLRSFCKRVSRGIVSKALLKSIKQEYNHFPLLWHCFRIRLFIIIWASDVLFPGTKPSCGWASILFSMQNFRSLLYNMPVKNLPRQDNNEIPCSFLGQL